MTSPSDDRPAWNAGGRPSGVWSGQQKSSAQNAPAQSTPAQQSVPVQNAPMQNAPVQSAWHSASPSAADTSAADTAADISAQTAAADNSHCFQCGKPLERDEIGLYKKLVNRGAREFLCKSCLAARFKMTEADCDTLIAHFKEAGCSMFF